MMRFSRPASRRFSLQTLARRLLSGVLSSVLLFQPIMQAGAQGIVSDNSGGKGPGVVSAPNGVPVVNITSPNASGISHNQYQDFNVGGQGVVLNNSPNAGRSELGGIILGNPNFTDRRDARLILNEVTSSNRSRLEGFTEVYGRAADVIIANPNGITCDGCGFINTPRATLSTGRPVVGADGTLNGLDVNDGDVTITGRGADATRIDAFDIVSRRVTIEAPVAAGGEINVIAGRNQVDYATRTPTAKADDGSAKPAVAIDSRALGGMYAGKISLVSTEKGVGVNTASDMATHSGQLTLTADGKLVMSGRTSSAGDTVVTSQSSDVVIEQQLGAQGKATVSAAKGKVIVKQGATVAADAGVSVSAKDIAVQGRVQSQTTVSAKATDSIDNTGTVVAGQQTQLEAARIANAGIIQSNGLLYVKGGTLDNAASGKILAQTGIDATLNESTNRGLIQSGGSLTLRGSTLTNTAGASLLVQTTLDGTLSGSLINQGTIESGGALLFTAAVLDNRLDALIRSGTTLELNATTTFANTGTLSGLSGLVVTAATSLSNGGKILSAGDVRLASATIGNSGTVLSDTRLVVTGGNATNTGRWQTLQGIDVTLSGGLVNTGAIETTGDLQLNTAGLDNRTGGSIRAAADSVIAAANGLASSGVIYGGSFLTLRTNGAMANTGSLLANDGLRIEAASFTNSLNGGTGGLVMALGDLEFAIAGTLTNDEGLLMAGNDLIIEGRNGGRAGAVVNLSGLIEATGGDLVIDAGLVQNQRKQWSIVQEAGSLNVGYNPIDSYGAGGGDKHYIFKVINPIYGVEEYYQGQQSERKPWEDLLVIFTDKIERLSDDSTVAGVLSAGRDIWISADDVVNIASEIVAGRDLDITAQRVTSDGAALYHIYYGEATYYGPTGLGCWNDSGTPCVSIPGSKSPGPKPREIGRIETDEAKGLMIAGRDVSIYAAERFGNGVDRTGVSVNGGVHQGFTSVLGQTAADRQTQAPGEHAAAGRIPGVPAGFLQQAALFRPAGPNSPYLYESRTEFTAFGHFYGSDYFLSAINFNPDAQLKRLGDAYFDTRLVREQVLKQAGMRWLSDAAQTDAEQMKALLDNGVAASRALALSAGVALTVEQQKALTADIVWYVTERVDGQDVLVPRLYLSQATLAKAGTGSGVAGGGAVSIVSNHITNSDVIKSGGSLYLEGTRALANLGGGIDAGGDLTLVSLGTIENVSQITSFTSQEGRGSYVSAAAWIKSGGDLTVSAGGDIIGRGATFTSGGDASLAAAGSVTLDAARTENHFATRGEGFSYSRDQVVHIGSSVGAEGNLTIAAGKQVTVAGSGVFAGKDLTVSGKEGVTIGSVVDEEHVQLQTSSRDGMRRSSTSIRTDGTTEVGSILAAGNDLKVVSGGDVSIRASAVNAGNDLLLAAGAGADGRKDANLTIEAGQNSTFYEEKTKSSGFGFSGGSVGYSSSKSTVGQSGTQTAGSRISAGNNATLLASQDIAVSGSQVLAGNDALLSAGRDVTITTAQETAKSWQDSKSNGVGIGFNGPSIFAGATSSKSTQRMDGQYSVGSELSAGNDLTINAGRDALISGSWLSAGQDLAISGRQVSILAADNLQTTRESHKQSQFGVTLGLSGAVGNAINTAYSNGTRMGQVQDSRLKGALAGQAAYNAYKGVDAWNDYSAAMDKWEALSPDVRANTEKPSAPIGLSVSVGGSTAKSERSTSSTWATASTIEAGRDVSIIARGGDGAAGNLSIIGSDITAGRDVTLAAKDDILIAAARQDSSTRGSNSSSGASIGVSLTTGNGFTVNAGANVSRGKEQGDGTTWRESTVRAGDTLTIISGGDTTIRGGQVAGETVLANIGGDLSIESLQDSSSYHSKQTSAGASVSIPIGMAGTASGSASISQQRIDHEFTSVGEQAGIYAGKGGFDITVGGNTDLVGSVIASEAAPDRNRLETETLSWRDLENKSSTSASGIGATVGLGIDPTGTRDASMVTGIDIAPGMRDSNSGTTHSAVAPGQIVIRDKDAQTQDVADLSRDTNAANAGAIQDDFDKRKIEERLEAAKIISSTGMQTVRDVANAQMNAAAQKRLDAAATTDPEEAARLRAEAQAIEDLWGETGAARLAGHALIGALASDTAGGSALSGGLGAVAGPLAADQIASHLKDLPQAVRDALITSVGTAAGAIVGGTNGAAMANSELKNNFLTAEQIEERNWKLREAGNDKEKIKEINDYYNNLDSEQQAAYTLCMNTADCRMKYSYLETMLIDLPSSGNIVALQKRFEAGEITEEEFIRLHDAYEKSLNDVVKALEMVWGGFRWNTPVDERTSPENLKTWEDTIAAIAMARATMAGSVKVSIKDVEIPSPTNNVKASVSNDFVSEVIEHNTQTGVRQGKDRGITGSHNQDAFLETVEITGAKVITKTTDTQYPGLIEYTYQLPKLDRAGNPTGEYKGSLTKTTYDPNILSNQKVADMSVRAAQDAVSIFNNNPLMRETSVIVDGYQFRVYKDNRTGVVTNAFIEFPSRTSGGQQ